MFKITQGKEVCWLVPHSSYMVTERIGGKMDFNVSVGAGGIVERSEIQAAHNNPGGC